MNNDETLVNIDKYWRASNYLTLLCMYINKNCMLKKNLRPDDLKKMSTGHWGASTGINFIYANLNAFISKYKVDSILVVGSGHSAASILANLYLEGTLQHYFEDITLDEKGIENLIAKFGKYNGFRTENYPGIPGNIYDGGELGYSLSVAFGAAFNLKEKIVFCILGDGECETGSIATGWNGIKFINPTESGVVLPIINLNGFKMGSKSILSLKSNKELRDYFSGLGYNAFIINSSHKELFNALEESYRIIKYNIKMFKENKKNNLKWPVIIFKSLKGLTGGYDDTKQLIEGRLISHKTPIISKDIDKKTILLEEWLLSYKPDELFSEDGKLVPSISSIIPNKDLRLGMLNSKINKIKNKLILPDLTKFWADEPYYSNIKVLDKYFNDLIILNPNIFKIFSPDELESNGLNILASNHSYDISNNNGNKCVLEILSENTCQGWMQGYLMMGNHGFFISYEAFAPIVSSMMSQYFKYLKQASKIKWRNEINSFNYILTSVCWSNTYSHQNPDFVNNAICRDLSYINVYYPSDANVLLACVNECNQIKNKINIIIVSKRKLPQYIDSSYALKAVEDGYYEINFTSNNKVKLDIILACSGDHMVKESIECANLLKSYIKNINIKIVVIIEITRLCEKRGNYRGINESIFKKIFPYDTNVLYNYHGYPSVITTLLFDRKHSNRFKVLGYSDEGDTSAPELIKMILNGVSRYNLCLEAIDVLIKNKKIDFDYYNYIKDDLNLKINKTFEELER